MRVIRLESKAFNMEGINLHFASDMGSLIYGRDLQLLNCFAREKMNETMFCIMVGFLFLFFKSS